MSLQKWSPLKRGDQLLCLSKHLSIEALQGKWLGNYQVIMTPNITATTGLKKGCKWLFLWLSSRQVFGTHISKVTPWINCRLAWLKGKGKICKQIEGNPNKGPGHWKEKK